MCPGRVFGRMIESRLVVGGCLSIQTAGELRELASGLQEAVYRASQMYHADVPQNRHGARADESRRRTELPLLWKVLRG